MSNNLFSIDFIGLGAQKAGSTWVADTLRKHPEVCLSEPKEVHFFNEKSSYTQNKHTCNYPNVNWYKKHFKHYKGEKVKGEFSPNYLFDKDVPKKIFTLFPKVKLIVCIRNPIQRAYSQYIMSKYYHKTESRPFEEVIRLEPEYIERGLYYKQLQWYLEYFPYEQIKVVFLEDIKKQPLEVVREIYSFLQIDLNYESDRIFTKGNPAKQVKSVFVGNLMRWGSKILVELGFSKLIPLLRDIGLKKMIMKANTREIDYPKMSMESRLYLQQQFQEDIQKLEEILQRDFSHWK